MGRVVEAGQSIPGRLGVTVLDRDSDPIQLRLPGHWQPEIRVGPGRHWPDLFQVTSVASHRYVQAPRPGA